MKALFTAVAESTGEGRNGHVRSDDGFIDTDVRHHKALGGSGDATNPEQLFAAGYAACFHSALLLVGRGAKVDMTGSTVTANVTLNADDQGGFFLSLVLQVHIPSVDAQTAEALAAKAHEVCPYSKATRGNIDVTLTAA